jgi:hypothetical protein
MKTALLPALLIGTLAGIVPALAQTSTTTTTTRPTSDGGTRSTTTGSDGSSSTTPTNDNGSTSTTTYQPPGSGYQPMGSSGYNPMGLAQPAPARNLGQEAVLGTNGATDAEIAKAIHDEHVCAPVKLYLDQGVVYHRADGCR